MVPADECLVIDPVDGAVQCYNAVRFMDEGCPTRFLVVGGDFLCVPLNVLRVNHFAVQNTTRKKIDI